MTSGGRFDLELRDGREDVGILDQRERRRAAAASFLIFCATVVRGAPVGDRGGEDRRRRPAAPLRRRAASRARSRRARSSRRADRAMSTGPETSVTSAPAAAAAARDRVALLAGRAVGDVAHRIDRLVRRAGGDDDALAGERAWTASSSSASIAATISSGSAMRPTPASPLSAISPAFGPTMRDAVGDELREVALRRRVRPHAAGSSPARAAPACRSRAARRWRDRRRGRSPSWPSGRRSPARPRSGRCRAPAGYGRRRTRSSASNRSVNGCSPASAPTDSGVTNSCAALVMTTRTAAPRSRRRRIRSSDL